MMRMTTVKIMMQDDHMDDDCIQQVGKMGHLSDCAVSIEIKPIKWFRREDVVCVNIHKFFLCKQENIDVHDMLNEIVMKNPS